MLSELEKNLIATFRSLLERRLHIHKLIVFGSRARGDADNDSDLDILVVVEEPENQDLLRFASECAFEADLGTDIVIAPVVVSREEWENGPERFSLLAIAVEREGIAV